MYGGNEDNDYYIRQNAANALGMIGSSKAIPHLIKRLNDKNEYVCQSVIKSLGDIGDTSIINHLIKILKEKEKFANIAAESLGKLKDKRAIEPLIEALRTKEWYIYDAAINALSNIGEAAINPLIKQLKNKNKCVKIAAIKALGKIKNEKIMKNLVKFLNDDEWSIRNATYETIKIFAEHSLKLFIDYFNNANDETKISLLEILEELFHNDDFYQKNKRIILGMTSNG
jgi:HEAT repeat protein